MTPALPGGYPLIADERRGRIGLAWTLPASLATHALILLALMLLVAPRPLETPRPRSIEVEILPAPPERPAVAAPTPAEIATPDRAAPAAAAAPLPGQGNPASPKAVARPDGMIRPSHLLAAGLLKEPASREVRETLPKLAPDERATQLCNIEATEQIRVAFPTTFPDRVSAYAFADTTVDGLTISASGAAYRSRRKWYRLRFACTVAPDFQSVSSFAFEAGPPIPQAEWASHDLEVEDEDE